MSRVPDDKTEVAAREAEPPFALALDVGTSSVRAAFYDARAREVSGTDARLARGFCTTADGGSEADAEESVGAVARLLDEALARAPSGVSARAGSLAVSCFWHSLVGLSRGGHAATPGGTTRAGPGSGAGRVPAAAGSPMRRWPGRTH